MMTFAGRRQPSARVGLPADPGDVPATLLHNVPGGHLPGTQAIRQVLEDAERRLDILNPYLIDPGMRERVLDAARRGAGLAAFIAPDPLDRVARDLETYLRQPMLDASRDAAAGALLNGWRPDDPLSAAP